MNMVPREGELKLIPIDAIEVLNPRERNSKIFEEIVGNIKAIGLKKPIQTKKKKKKPKKIARKLFIRF